MWSQDEGEPSKENDFRSVVSRELQSPDSILVEAFQIKCCFRLKWLENERERESERDHKLRSLQSVIEEANSRILKLQSNPWRPVMLTRRRQTATGGRVCGTEGQRLRHQPVAKPMYQHHEFVGLLALNRKFWVFFSTVLCFCLGATKFFHVSLWFLMIFARIALYWTLCWNRCEPRRSYGLTKRLPQHQNPDEPADEATWQTWDQYCLEGILIRSYNL